VAVLLALLSAAAYGAGDFANGLAARSYASGAVTVVGQTLGLLAACIALLLFAGAGPSAHALLWGALSGVGSAVGTFSLYHGLAVGRMTVVATVSAILTAVIPVLVGIGLGNHLGALAVAGIVIAMPAIALVSWQPEHRRGAAGTLGVGYGVLAGAGFGLLLVALARAGTRSGAWPLVPGQAVSLLLLIPFGVRGMSRDGRPAPSTGRLMLAGGVLTGLGNLLYLAATGHGELAVVAVLTSLYPAVTVLLARFTLAEHWSRQQVLGLVSAAAAIVLVSVR
jgi:drug/metabolite transporter (DMT)-like permease